jgi:hypothetical protein
MPKNNHQKKTEAEDRASHRAKMSHKDQIARLDSLFGKDSGAAKERVRLKALIEGASAKSSKGDQDDSDRPKKTKSKKKQD